jgi:hypothetical protein
MFKKIQNHLLLHHPLLWNIKLVPVVTITVLLHIIVFIIGYTACNIDFTTDGNNYIRPITTVIVIFFGAIIALFIFIIWLVYYFNNNSFKAFYPKNSFSLYKEWLLILLICLITSTFPLSYFIGTNLKATNYFSESELQYRGDIISMASIFAGDDFNDYGSEYDSIDSVYVQPKFYTYFGKEYSVNSLLNKSIHSISYREHDEDSIMEYRVKRWLHEKRRDSIAWLFTEFDKIAKSHNIKYNLTPNTWLEKIYHPDGYTEYPKIETKERYIVNLSLRNEPFYESDEDEEDMQPDNASVKQVGDSLIISDPYNRIAINLTENDVRLEKGIRYVYPKNYVPLDVLEDSYSEINAAYHNRKGFWIALLGFVYFCLTLSAVIFSFRVTTGAKWLIALIAFGLTAAITGIITVFIDETVGYPLRRFADESYFALWILIEISILAYFLFKKNKKNTKSILLNIALWLMPWILPVLTIISIEYYNDMLRVNGYERDIYTVNFIENNIVILALTFIVVHLAGMFFFTKAIKKWKGTAES